MTFRGVQANLLSDLHPPTLSSTLKSWLQVSTSIICFPRGSTSTTTSTSASPTPWSLPPTGGGTWIADEQGLGKTRQAIVTAKAKAAGKILVVCKSSLRGNWEAEINRCAPEWTTQVLRGTRPYETVAHCLHHLLRPAGHLDRRPDRREHFDCPDRRREPLRQVGRHQAKPVQRTVAALEIGDDVRRRNGPSCCSPAPRS